MSFGTAGACACAFGLGAATPIRWGSHASCPGYSGCWLICCKVSALGGGGFGLGVNTGAFGFGRALASSCCGCGILWRRRAASASSSSSLAAFSIALPISNASA